jgi:hypothetical protein
MAWRPKPCRWAGLRAAMSPGRLRNRSSNASCWSDGIEAAHADTSNRDAGDGVGDLGRRGRLARGAFCPRKCPSSHAGASSCLRDAHPKWRTARVCWRGATPRREDARAWRSRVSACLRDARIDDDGDRARSEDARTSQRGASLCEEDARLCEEDARTSQRGASLRDAGPALHGSDARLAQKDARLRRTAARGWAKRWIAQARPRGSVLHRPVCCAHASDG